MSTSHTPQPSYEEVASIEHIHGLIEEARRDIPERISAAERVRQELWATENADEVARLISNTRRRGAGKSLPFIIFACIRFPAVRNRGQRLPCMHSAQHTLPIFLIAVDEMVPDRDWSNVAVWRSRQTTLRQLCRELGRACPYYQIQTRDFTVVGVVHRFFVLILPGTGKAAVPAVGRFSTDPHIAREDGASEMIRVLLEISVGDRGSEIQLQGTTFLIQVCTPL
ncbi:hypothetical protein HN51_028860 [Arachis hypogaea]